MRFLCQKHYKEIAEQSHFLFCVIGFKEWNSNQLVNKERGEGGEGYKERW